jgi:hypothetical protein
MGKFLKSRGVDLTITTIGLTVLMTGPAWAGPDPVPGPDAGILAGGAIIGTLALAKWLRRK